MKRKRERFEVIHDILFTVQSKGHIGPTRLLQLSNLSPKMFKDYLGELLEKELLKEEQKKDKKVYVMTDKGHMFLERYKIFSNFIEQMGL